MSSAPALGGMDGIGVVDIEPPNLGRVDGACIVDMFMWRWPKVIVVVALAACVKTTSAATHPRGAVTVSIWNRPHVHPGGGRLRSTAIRSALAGGEGRRGSRAPAGAAGRALPM